MPTLKQIILASLLICTLLGSAFAQDSTLTITAAATDNRVRITAPTSVVQMHIEVYAAQGAKLFDQEIRGGNIVDWHLQDGQAQRVAPGSYVCVVTAKSTSGRLSQKLGTVKVEENSLIVQPLDNQLSVQQAQAIGPVEPNASWTIATKEEFPVTTGSGARVIYTGGNRFLRTRKAPAAAGRNLFLSSNAGNFPIARPLNAVSYFDYFDNLGLGENALFSVTSNAHANIGIGKTALYYLQSGYQNVGIGWEALLHTLGNNNVGVGYKALTANVAYANTAIGSTSLASNTEGFGNVAVGYQALLANTTGDDNTAVGNQALIGDPSGSQASTGSYNSAFGSHALDGNRTGSNNTGVGFAAGYIISSGSNNVLIGYQAGDNLTTGSNNIILGYDIDAPSATQNNGLNIGNLIFGKDLTSTGSQVSSGKIGIGTASPGAKLQVTSGDVYVETQSKGVILRATDGANCYRLTVNNAGTIAATLVTCP